MDNNLEEVKGGIGSLIINLHSLEFALRLCLHELDSSVGARDFPNIGELHRDDNVPLCPLTNYDTLGEVIRKFNEAVESKLPTVKVDSAVVDLRDTLAHGRTVKLNPDGPLRLLKFGRPDRASQAVPVISSDEISCEWLKAKCGLVFQELRKVVNAGRELGLPCFPQD